MLLTCCIYDEIGRLISECTKTYCLPQVKHAGRTVLALTTVVVGQASGNRHFTVGHGRVE